MRTKFLASLFSVIAAATMTAAPALAVENLYEQKVKTGLVKVNTNFTAKNVGEPELVAGALTVKCKTSYIGGSVSANTAGVAPKAEVQSVTFSECKEATAPNGEVVVRTKTTTPWTLEWVAAGKLRLTGVNVPELELKGLGVTCGVTNKALSNFENTWTNVASPGFSEVAAAAQLLTVTGAVGPTSATETATYKLVAVGDAKDNLWLE
jgi:hypothetical protein